MIDAILKSNDTYNDAAKTFGFKFTFPSINKLDVSDEVRFTGFNSTKGKLVGLKIYTVSDDYEISLRVKSGVVPPSVDEIVKIIKIDKVYQESGFVLLVANNDEPIQPYFYGVLTNNSKTLDTGVVIIEFIMQRM